MAVNYSSISEIRWNVGLVIGPILATLPAILHFGLQWMLRKRVHRFFPSKPWSEAMLLNLPVAVLGCLSVIGAYRGTAAKPVFEKFLSQPIPSSVKIIRHGGGQINFAEGTRIGIWFEIEQNQLKNLIKDASFELVKDDGETEYWKSLFWNYSRLNVPLKPPYDLYFRESNSQTKRAAMSSTGDGHTEQESIKSVSYDVGEYLFCPSNSLSVFYLRLSH